VQQRLFPQHRPALATLDYAAYCQPALGMSGDYYDFLDLGSGRLGLLVADVVGKGVPAALLMASIHAAIRTRAALFQNRCGELLSDLNTLLYESTDPGMYATVFYAVYDESSRVLTYANAGHQPPVLLRAVDRESLRLESETAPGRSLSINACASIDCAARARRLAADVHRWNHGSAEYGG
jgi:phosphoserine phosphatase RsbU/P